MANRGFQTRIPLTVHSLEARDLPSSAPWLTEPFQSATATGLPSGWSQWSSTPGTAFKVEAASGLGDTGRLIAAGTSITTARAWLAAPYAADVEASVAVLLASPVPVHLVVRGQNLNTPTPTYYAATLARGGEVQLLKVVKGQATVLASVKSASYFSSQWATLTLRAAGDQLQIRLHRGDTNSYLDAQGNWSRNDDTAIDKRDSAIIAGGSVGFTKPSGAATDIALDSLRIGPANPTTPTVLNEERFGTAAESLPASWSHVSAGTTYRVLADETLRVSGGSTSESRAWLSRTLPADVQVTSSLFVDSLVPAGLIARGVNLHTTKPTYYSASVSRGLEVKLSRTLEGIDTVLATVKSKTYVSGLWVQASLAVKGDQLGVQVFRSDTGQYLPANGEWRLAPAWAVLRGDTSIRSGERAGLRRGLGYAGELVVDNVLVTAAPARVGLLVPIPTARDKPTTPLPPVEDLPSAPVPLPTVPPPVVVVPTVPPVAVNPRLPVVERHYSHIRVAELAYHGTPITSFELGLLKNSIDLVIPNSVYLSTIAAASPTTPQFVYTNISNIYLGLLTDWLDYADRMKLSRESAFYHVAAATPFTGLSASAVPVDRFWSVQSSDAFGAWTNVTSLARVNPQVLPFGTAVNASVAFGAPEKFREINFDLTTMAGSGWLGKYEYVRAVDASGTPTAWAPLTLLADGTINLRRDGQVTFDPPRDWVSASLNGSAKLFYIRLRTTSAGSAPAAASVKGRDYTAFRGATLGGVTPAFDHAADLDRDGYLNDREYAARKSGFNARFVSESRLTYPTYGPMRYATNVADASFRAWAVDYHVRLARAMPLARGFFVDNSVGKIDIDPATVKESLAGYAASYGALLGTVNTRLMADGKWLIANTAGAGTAAEPIAAAGVSTLEEFALRPMTANHVQLDDLAALLKYRRQLSGGKAYEILDSLPQGLDATNDRVELTTLAMYYVVADPELSMLMLNGGNEPASSWTRHWFDAIKFNVGKPKGSHTVFAQGFDPVDRTLAYKVYARQYDNALVLYKPVSYTRGKSGTIADTTATVHALDGLYRPLNADGSLGAAVRQVRLRNGDGLVLVKA